MKKNNNKTKNHSINLGKKSLKMIMLEYIRLATVVSSTLPTDTKYKMNKLLNWHNEKQVQYLN